MELVADESKVSLLTGHQMEYSSKGFGSILLFKRAQLTRKLADSCCRNQDEYTVFL